MKKIVFFRLSKNGCRRKSRGTKDQQLMDQMILRDCKKRRKFCHGMVELSKAYDMVPHLWILECMELFGIAENVRKLVESSMNSWKMKLIGRVFEKLQF